MTYFFEAEFCVSIRIGSRPSTNYVSDDGGYARKQNPQCGNTGEQILLSEPRRR